LQVIDGDPEVMPRLECAQRIRTAFGSAPRFVVLLRDPADRAISQYEMMQAWERDQKPWLIVPVGA
jgi:hypothetical protein